MFDAYNRVPPREWDHKHLAAYGAQVRARVSEWFADADAARDWRAPADVYYGRQSLHEFLERTTWHAGQHCRQIMWVLEGKLGIAPIKPLGSEVWTDLPMPDQVWDPA